MRLSGAIEYGTVSMQELLHGSTLQHYDIGTAVPPAIRGAQYFVWAILFLIFFCLVFRGQTAVFFSWAGSFLRSPVKRTYYDTSPAVRYGLPLSLILLLPLTAYLLYGTSAVGVPYILILAVLTGYFVLRFLILAGISYVSGENDLVTALNRMSCIGFMVVSAVFCILFIMGMFLPDLYPLLTDEVAVWLTAVLLVLYFIGLIRIFFAFKEPPLLTILYLCTLEIVPVALAAAAVLKY